MQSVPCHVSVLREAAQTGAAAGSWSAGRRAWGRGDAGVTRPTREMKRSN